MRKTTSRVGAPMCALLFIAGAGCTADEPADATEPLIGGGSARSSKLDAVGQVGYITPRSGWQPSCNGTLISPTAVLTTEDCTNNRYPLTFGVGADATPRRQVAVRKIAKETSIAGGYRDLGIDLAVLHLAEPITEVTPMPIAELTAERVGSRLSTLSYGEGAGPRAGRRAGSMTLRGIGGHAIALSYGTFERFLAEGIDRLYPFSDPVADRAYLADEYAHAFPLLDVEAWLGGAEGDVQPWYGDDGAPILAQQDGKTTLFGLATWRYDIPGAAFATINATSKDFIEHEVACTDIPASGFCDGGALVRCATPAEGGYRALRVDCAAAGQTCAVGGDGVASCVADVCGGASVVGRCDGDDFVRCSGPGEGARHKLVTQCGDLGLTCGSDAVTGELGCVEAP